MPDLKNIKEYIRALEHMLHFFRQILDEEKRITPAPSTPDEKLSEFTDLRFMTKSNIWPDAIEPDLISGDKKEEKINRAEGVISEFMNVDLRGKRFLDFGCGDGYVASQAVEHGASLSVGYDITNQGWDSHAPKKELVFTTELTDNEFDVVLMNDVLDHTTDPVAALKQVEIAKKPDAQVFVRCHPWASRHGTHLYRKLNKAYLHLVFTQAELLVMGLKGEETLNLLDPMKSYKEWFGQTNMKVVSESIITQPVDAFFTTRPVVVRRIKENWKASSDPELAAATKYPHDHMKVQFADFVLV